MATTEDRGAAESLAAWRANVYDRAPERTDELFSTISGIENEPLATPDNVDTDPSDPNRCGDSDADGCDDCSSGMFDPSNDCDVDPGGGTPSGCCETGGGDGRQLLLALFVGMFLLRPRRRSR